MSRYFIARHGETVFNAVGRIQGEAPHTPLTRAGFGQAEEMGRVLRDHLGPAPRLAMWASPTDRALQTLAIVAEHLGLDWHAARIDARLAEMRMGEWGGLYHRDIRAAAGPPPGGEWFDEIAVRVGAWFEEQAGEEGDRLVIMHGVSSRVLRGVMTGAPHRPECRAPVAASLPQGSIVCIEESVEQVIHLGTGGRGVAAASLSA